MIGEVIDKHNHGTWSDYLIEPNRWASQQWEQIDIHVCKSDVSWGDAILRIATIALLCIVTFVTSILAGVGCFLKMIEGRFFSSCRSKTDHLQGLSDKMIPVYEDENNTICPDFENLEKILNEKIAPRAEKYFAEHGHFCNITFQVNTSPPATLEGAIHFTATYFKTVFTNTIPIRWQPLADAHFDVSEQSIMKALMQFG